MQENQHYTRTLTLCKKSTLYNKTNIMQEHIQYGKKLTL
jgi:hypothetical protein